MTTKRKRKRTTGLLPPVAETGRQSWTSGYQILELVQGTLWLVPPLVPLTVVVGYPMCLVDPRLMEQQCLPHPLLIRFA